MHDVFNYSVFRTGKKIDVYQRKPRNDGFSYFTFGLRFENDAALGIKQLRTQAMLKRKSEKSESIRAEDDMDQTISSLSVDTPNEGAVMTATGNPDCISTEEDIITGRLRKRSPDMWKSHILAGMTAFGRCVRLEGSVVGLVDW